MRAQGLLVAALKHFADAGLSPYEAEIRRLGEGDGDSRPVAVGEPKETEGGSAKKDGAGPRSRRARLAGQLDGMSNDD